MEAIGKAAVDKALARHENQLKRLESHAEKERLAAELAHQLAESHPDLGSLEEWSDLLYYLLHQTLQELLHRGDHLRQQVSLYTQFVRSDVENCLNEGWSS